MARLRFAHGSLVIARAVADVEARHDAGRDSAAPPEEAVSDSGEQRRADDLDVFSQGCE